MPTDERQVFNPQVQTDPAGIPPSETPMPAPLRPGDAPPQPVVNEPSAAPAIDEQALREREDMVSRREEALDRRMANRRELHSTELTDKDVEGQVIGEYSACAFDAFGAQPNVTPEAERALRSTTICVLITRNGFPIVGTSVAAAPENYEHNDGLKWAKADAMGKLWMCEEYALRNRLMGLEPLPDDMEPPATGDIAETWPPRRAVA